ncbi:hypothetical protein FGB62_99g08 [Gracilaria domingensis]|nr:hypothetical protein FGB62_99g08 [Gracilaria domingensis]
MYALTVNQNELDSAAKSMMERAGQGSRAHVELNVTVGGYRGLRAGLVLTAIPITKQAAARAEDAFPNVARWS